MSISGLRAQVFADSIDVSWGSIDTVHGHITGFPVNVVTSCGAQVIVGSDTVNIGGSIDGSGVITSLSTCMRPSAVFTYRIFVITNGGSLYSSVYSGVIPNLPDTIAGVQLSGPEDLQSICSNALSNVSVDSLFFYTPAGQHDTLTQVSFWLGGNLSTNLTNARLYKNNSQISFLTSLNGNILTLYTNPTIMTNVSNLTLKFDLSSPLAAGQINGEDFVSSGVTKQWASCFPKVKHISVVSCTQMTLNFLGPQTVVAGETIAIGYNGANGVSLTYNGQPITYPSGSVNFTTGPCIGSDSVVLVMTDLLGQTKQFVRHITVSQRCSLSLLNVGTFSATVIATSLVLPNGTEYVQGPAGPIICTFTNVGGTWKDTITINGLQSLTPYTCTLLYSGNGISSAICNQAGLMQSFTTLPCTPATAAVTWQNNGGLLTINLWAIGSGTAGQSYNFQYTIYENGLAIDWNFSGFGGTAHGSDSTLLYTTIITAGAGLPYDVELIVSQLAACGGNPSSLTQNILPWVGIEELEQSNYSVYPNPTLDVVHVQVERLKKWTLYDVMGQVVATGSTSEISLINFSNGFYTLEFFTGDKVGRTRILKQ